VGVTPAIRLIVGLGNPGSEYAQHRHNAGYWFIDRIAAGAQVMLRAEPRFGGQTGRAMIAGNAVWLLQPTRFMNLSGQSIAALAHFHRFEPTQIVVAHDDLDLPPGAARLKFGGGSGGHNGLKDTTAALGTDGYWRLRLGIGHPRELYAGHKEVAAFVLERPSREQQESIDLAIDRALAIVPLLVGGAIERAAQRLHTKAKPNTAQAPKNAQPSHNTDLA
jgi:PTH1 family peptidyl-tRNA hydrolase